ncbi:MAG: protein kinase [Candidatus Eisenbacteria bacterium]|nr:protein kinase [Candidatus Eisenbacteria bacterium]
MHHRFRGFELMDRIGSGGMSTIFLGVQTALDRKVAIKLLHPALAHDEQFIARFEREAKSASSLGHPNVVTIIDFGSENGAYYIVMELVDGADLRSIFQRCDRIPPEITLAILEEVCHGLEAAHEKGIVHRDIKPGNILLSSDGRVKIADFGLARQVNDFDRLSNITMTGAIVGTPAYMSPEQLAGAPVDHRTDIYSLGVMAYEFFVGQRPFRTTPSGVNTEEKILRGPIPPMYRDGARLPKYIVDLVSKMLAKDPEKRFNEVGELLRAVENAMEQIDDSGQLLKHRRDYLKRFAQDPIAFARELRKRRLSRHLRRADHFVGMGLERINDAVAQYLAALRIDPECTTALEALERLEREYGRSIVEEVIEETTSVFSTSDPEVSISGALPTQPKGDPLLDEIDSGDDLISGRSLSGRSLSGRSLSGDGSSDSEADPPHGARPDRAGFASDPTEIAPSGAGTPRPAKNGATTNDATQVAKDRPHRVHPDVAASGGAKPVWARPWIWVVLVVSVIAVPSFTIGPLRPGGRVTPQANDTAELAGRRSSELDRDHSTVATSEKTATATDPNGPQANQGDASAPGTASSTSHAAADAGATTEHATGTNDAASNGRDGAARSAGDGATPKSKEATSQAPGASTSKKDAAEPHRGTDATSSTGPGGVRDSETSTDGAGSVPAKNTNDAKPERESSAKNPPVTTPPTSGGAAQPKAAEKAPSLGFIEVRVVPVADIYVDGQLAGRKSRVAIQQADPTRPHVVEVRHPSFGVHRWTNVTAARDTTQLVHRYSWGDVRVEWTPAGNVDLRFDDLILGEVGSFARQVAVGEHRLHLRREGYKIARVQIVDSAGTRTLSGPEAAGALATYPFDVAGGQTARVVVAFEKQ